MKKHFSTGAIASAIERERIPPLCVAALAQESNPAAAPACGKRFGRFVSMTSSSLPPLSDYPRRLLPTSGGGLSDYSARWQR